MPRKEGGGPETRRGGPGKETAPNASPINSEEDKAAIAERQPSWRDRIKVHPAAELFPMMSDAELDDLAKDISRHGIRTPIVWLKGQLLDGRNRVAAVHRIVVKARRDEILTRWANGKDCINLTMEPDPVAYVVSANLHRRHLTAEQKREVIAKLLQANPERSDRATAKIAKVSPTTVGVVRAELEESGDVSKLDTRTDTAGRQQPAHRPSAPIVHRSSLPPPSPERLGEHARTITNDELTRIRKEAPREGSLVTTVETVAAEKTATRRLDEAVRELEKLRSSISGLPLAARVARARRVLDALGLIPDDLQPIGGAA